MILSQKQRVFSRLVARLISELIGKGYEITFGEAWRPSETAALYAKEGKGIAASLHSLRLAVDLNLFKDGKFLTQAAEYAEAGALWKSYSTPDYECCWGGDFHSDRGVPTPDADHFSISNGGIK